MKKNPLQLLQQKMAMLTASQRKVADYILKNPLEALFLTLDQIAGAVGTSTTTVMRLSFSIGYSGYADFQKDLQEMLRNRVSPSIRLEANMQAVSGNSLFAKCAEKQIDNIRETVEFLSDDTTKRCVNMISNAKKIYIIGVRTTFGAAYYLYQGLNQILGNCEMLEPSSGNQVERIMDIGPKDLIIAISLPRYARGVVELVQTFKELRGTQVVSITDGYTSPLAAISDLVLPCAVGSLAFHNSIVGAVVISDFLITSLALQDSQKTKKRLDCAEKVFKNLQFHI